MSSLDLQQRISRLENLLNINQVPNSSADLNVQTRIDRIRETLSPAVEKYEKSLSNSNSSEWIAISDQKDFEIVSDFYRIQNEPTNTPTEIKVYEEIERILANDDPLVDLVADRSALSSPFSFSRAGTRQSKQSWPELKKVPNLYETSVFIPKFINPAMQDSSNTLVAEKEPLNEIHKPKVDCSEKAFKLLRYLNLIRAIGISSYSIFQYIQNLKNPFYVSLGATNLFISCIAFTGFDVVVSLIQCFGKNLFRKKRRNFETIWDFIDLELTLDLLVSGSNLVLNVFSYRASELVTLNNLNDMQINQFEDLLKPKYYNFVVLMLFVASLVYTLIFHSFRIGYFVLKRGSIALGFLIFVKFLFLAFDFVAQGLLFYQVLVNLNQKLFTDSTSLALILPVTCFSFFVTSTANVAINFPLQYAFLKMKSAQNTFLDAFKTSFNALLMFLGLIGLYFVIIQIYFLKEVRDFDLGNIPMVFNSGIFTSLDALLVITVVNLAINYSGVLFILAFWLYSLLF